MSATGEPPRPDGGREAGTTLVEALVTMTILAAIGAIAFPVLRQGAASAAFGQAAVGVRADLRMARAQALVTGRRVQLVVSPQGRNYGWTPGPLRALTTGLSMAPTGAALSFYPDGSSSGGRLSLSNGRLTARFEVDPASGLARTAS
ncbi:MAG: hypothetical protein IIZ63_00240 [Caulobacteraceae bacterium]|nr:hypothetical protein [Caulobacteraceae bacterium]